LSNSKKLHPVIGSRAKLLDENRALQTKKFLFEHHLEELKNELRENLKGSTKVDTKALLELVDAKLFELRRNKRQYH